MRIGKVVYLVYEATLSPERWPGALSAIADIMNSKGALINGRRDDVWRILLNSPSLDAAVKAYVEGEWWKRNPWLTPSVALGYRTGDVYRDQDMLNEKELAKEPFYTEFLAHFGLKWQMAAAIQSDLGDPTGLIVQRGGDAGPYTSHEMAEFLQLSRHVEQSLRISAAVQSGTTAHGSVAAAFDAMDRPAFVLDHEQRPVAANRSAKALMDRFFKDHDGRLHPVTPVDGHDLATVVKTAHVTDDQDTVLPPKPLVVADANGEKTVLWSVPLLGDSAHRLGLHGDKRHVLVIGQQTKSDRVVDPALLRDALGLTLGEARLAALVAAGISLQKAAVQLGIAESTARFVLKRVFGKLNIHRQTDLVAKVAALNL